MTASYVAAMALLKFELRAALRQRSHLATTVIFFIVVCSLFPLAIGTQPLLLQRIGGGIIWVAALLASLLSIEKLFEHDKDDGFLEQLLLSSAPLSLLIIAKLIAHYLIVAIPLLIMAPLLGSMFHLSLSMISVLWLSLLLGLPIIQGISAIGAALTVCLPRGGLLLALLVLPLTTPALIISTMAIDAARVGLPISGYFALLLALLLVVAALAPMTIAAALKIAVE